MPCSSSALFSYPPHSGILSHKPGLRVPRASASVSPFLSATFCPQPFHWLSLLLLEQPGLSHQGCPEGGGGLGTRSCLTLVTPWTVARQAPLSMGFSRKEYWSGLSCPPPGDLPDPGIEHRSPALQAASLPTEPPGKLRLCAMLLLLLSRFSHVRLCVTPWTAVHQAPPSMGFSRQEYWSGLPLPSLAMCYR